MEGVKWEKGARDVGSICLRSWFIRFGCGLSALWKCKMVKESEGGGGGVLQERVGTAQNPHRRRLIFICYIHHILQSIATSSY